MKTLIGLSLVLSLTAGAAPRVSDPPLFPAAPQQLLGSEYDRPPHQQAWFWATWGVATAQTVLTILCTMAFFSLLQVTTPGSGAGSGPPR